MPVKAKDRHVLALAVHVGAPTIVTDNARDFPQDVLESRSAQRLAPGRNIERAVRRA